MNPLNDTEIHQVVQRVLKQVLGQSQPPAAVPPAPTSEHSPPGTLTRNPAKESGCHRGRPRRITS